VPRCVPRSRASYIIDAKGGDVGIDPKRVAWHMQRIDTLDFDVFGLEKVTNGSPLLHTAHYIFWKRGLFGSMGVSRDTFLRFVGALQRSHDAHDAAFHNGIRAADLLQSVHVMLAAKGVAEAVSPRDVFVTLLAALVADVGHPGLTNSHARTAGHPIAVAHGEERGPDGSERPVHSVLERAHVAEARRLLTTNGDIVAEACADEPDPVAAAAEMWAEVSAAVLATSMEHNDAFVADFRGLLAAGGVAMIVPSERRRALQLLLKAADVLHCAKPFFVARQWTCRLVSEMYFQGARARATRGAGGAVATARDWLGHIDLFFYSFSFLRLSVRLRFA
jgi:hypothetical protein